MDAAADRPEFEPPPQPGLWRGFSLAILAHLLLILALAWGLRWKNDSGELAAEAELWSSVPQEAAPRQQPAPPPPKEQVAPPPPPPKPVVREQPKPDPAKREADIALEREKKRKEAEAREKREAQEREQRQKKLEAQRKQQELEKQRELQAKLAAEKRRKEEEDKKRREKARQEEEARLAKLREENLKRIQALAGGGGPASSVQSSGPSAGWAARVRARVKPNIVFTEAVSGNPEARVEVRLAPDGTIVSKRIVKSSGHKGWDEAVLRALDKTEVLPRDDNGRVPTPVELIFRPKDLG